MRWEGRRTSSNVEDRRGQRVARRGTLGCGGILLVLGIAWLTGADPRALLMLLGAVQQVAPPAAVERPSGPVGAPGDELGGFASRVLASTEDVWKEVFSASDQPYEEPRLVLFSGAVRSACGTASAAVGPFYCQLDQQVYLDTSFFRELSQRLGAPGDFAAAYVIAHEVGHHVQNQLGVADQVNRLRERASERQANALSVRMELQADCLAGVWGHHANRQQQIIEPGDFEEGMRAAASIGDDRLQRMAQGYVQPESWTHGSSEERVSWLRRGLESGNPDACDTFQQARR
jgi:predicted metalloprotease